MPEKSNFTIRLSKAAREFNVGYSTIVEFLAKKGFQIDSAPNTKLTADMYELLAKEFQGEKDLKNQAKKLGNLSYKGGSVSIESVVDETTGTAPMNEEYKKKVKLKGQNESIEKKVVLKIPFSELVFGQGFVSITYKENRYYFKSKRIKDYDSTLKQIYNVLSYEKRNSIKSHLVTVEIVTKTKSFTFKDINIRKTINDLKKRYLTSKKVRLPNKESQSKKVGIPNKTPINIVQDASSAFKTMALDTGNIRFYNGYYLIFQTNDGEVDNTITPYRVNDPDSHEILNLVHKYFERLFEQKHIIVKIDKTKILEPSKLDLFQLSNYVKTLNRNLDIKGEWWVEVQNCRKPSLTKCRSISPQIVKKKVSMKNGYLDNLSSTQSEKKLISVYEVNHGKEEDAFIFTINMPNNRYAIIFENASNDASTTTWVFVTKKENYEQCVNLVFDYFTDYTIDTKRSTLRTKTVNPPEKFKAEDYTFIVHDDLGQWLKKLNKILEQTAEPSDIAFVPGLHIPESSESRDGHGDTITIKHLHNQLMRKLYDKLCCESGKDNVGTEIRVGTKRIDCVVKGDDHYDIYEIKTAESPFECVTEALGQLCQYTYLYCRDKIGKMVIVGASETNKEVEQYLSWFRKNYSLQLYYMKV